MQIEEARSILNEELKVAPFSVREAIAVTLDALDRERARNVREESKTRATFHAHNLIALASNVDVVGEEPGIDKLWGPVLVAVERMRGIVLAAKAVVRAFEVDPRCEGDDVARAVSALRALFDQVGP